jgi:excisionase family DNA binding protein
MTEELVTIDEISKYLGVKKSTLYSKVETRQIPHYKIGNLLRFRKSEVDAWLQRTKCEPGESSSKTMALPRRNGAKHTDIDEIVSKAIAEVGNMKYTLPKGRPDRKEFRGLRKEVKDGSI